MFAGNRNILFNGLGMVGVLDKIARLTVGSGVGVVDFIKCIEKHGETKILKAGETPWVKR